jgi:NitT/TauT family transport system ATP-binding protein
MHSAARAYRSASQVELVGVGHHYRRQATPALAGIDATFEPGDAVALVGRSGCGKSTLLHIIAGLLRPSAGEVLIDGAPVRGPSPRWNMMFQSPSLYPWMTVGENAALGLRFAGKRRVARERVGALLDLVQLGELYDSRVQDLSGGQQQRVALARSLAVEPDVLLLDEPFSALDTFTRTALQRDVRRIARERGITLIVVTHDVDEAVLMGDRVLVMAAEPGRIAADTRIDLPAERARDSIEFVQAKDRLMRLFRASVGTEGLAALAGAETPADETAAPARRGRRDVMARMAQAHLA